MTPLDTVLQYVGYIGVAVLAVLGNHFYGIPDNQLTASLVTAVLTILGGLKVQNALSKSAGSNPATPGSDSASATVPNSSVASPILETTLGKDLQR